MLHSAKGTSAGNLWLQAQDNGSSPYAGYRRLSIS